MRNKVTLWHMKSHVRYKAWDIKISSEPQITGDISKLLISWRAVRNERVRGGPTVLVLVTGWRCGVESWRGRSLHRLHYRRTGVELPNRRRPRQILYDFNLYCREPDRTREREEERGIEKGRAGERREERQWRQDQVSRANSHRLGNRKQEGNKQQCRTFNPIKPTFSSISSLYEPDASNMILNTMHILLHVRL